MKMEMRKSVILFVLIVIFQDSSCQFRSPPFLSGRSTFPVGTFNADTNSQPLNPFRPNQPQGPTNSQRYSNPTRGSNPPSSRRQVGNQQQNPGYPGQNTGAGNVYRGATGVGNRGSNPLDPRNSNRRRPINRGPVQLSIELLIVVDQKMRDKWYKNVKIGEKENKEKKTRQTINEFLYSVMHGVNTLYASLMQYGIYLDLRIVDIKHVPNLWSQDALQPGTSDQLSTKTAIDVFYDWSWKSRRQLLPFDHAMLLTGFDLLDPKNASKPTTGVAYKAVMCRYGSVSVIQSDPSYQFVDTIAHELGHSLGCDHDGEKVRKDCKDEGTGENSRKCQRKNACKEDDGFIMSSRTEVNSTNRWYFSPCSANAIKRDLYTLERDGANCLRVTNTSRFRAPHLGSVYNADRQCQNLFGKEAYFCRDFYNNASDYEHLCHSMWCSENNTAGKCRSHIASDGFLCGDSKICIRGKCVKEERAPPAYANCPQGDQPGVVIDELTCEDIARDEPHRCYDDYYRRKCCVSCPNVKQNVEGCEYGDHALECKTDLEPPVGCYFNEELCCATCAGYKNDSNTGCEYGDKSSWCKKQLKVPQGCYLNEELCCGTCSEEKRADNTDCPYGDRYPEWCPTVTPYRCYNETVRGWCCDSCASSANFSKSSCEYGDKFKNCEDLIYPYACYHPTNAEACCNLCSNYYTPEQEGCEYGDKQAWCWKLTLTYTNEEWCPLDKDNHHCCGVCENNRTDVPVFGYRLKEEGLTQVNSLGAQFRDDVRNAVQEKRRIEKQKKEEEERQKRLAAEKSGNSTVETGSDVTNNGGDTNIGSDVNNNGGNLKNTGTKNNQTVSSANTSQADRYSNGPSPLTSSGQVNPQSNSQRSNQSSNSQAQNNNSLNSGNSGF